MSDHRHHPRNTTSSTGRPLALAVEGGLPGTLLPRLGSIHAELHRASNGGAHCLGLGSSPLPQMFLWLVTKRPDVDTTCLYGIQIPGPSTGTTHIGDAAKLVVAPTSSARVHRRGLPAHPRRTGQGPGMISNQRPHCWFLPTKARKRAQVSRLVQTQPD